MAAAPSGSGIEGVWSFNGGAVGIQGLPDGTLQGTVVAETTFAECPHPVGQVMWTAMKPRPDGSYWGFHQWYVNACEADPELGLTAWRVMTASDGSRTLDVCFSHPGDASQPQIAADGKATGATYGCNRSAALGPLPGSSASGAAKVGLDSFLTTPASSACLGRRSLKIVLRKPKYDPLRELIVRVKGKRVADLTGKALERKSLRLRKLPEGTFRVKLVAITVLGQRYTGGRTYRACSPGPGKIHTPGHRRHRG